MGTNQGKPYPEFLADMADMIKQCLEEKCSIPQDKATDFAFKVTEMLRHTYGGEMLYFPKAVHIDLSMRDMEILKKCKFMTYNEVAKEFGVSTRRIYQILFQAKFGTASCQPFLPLGDAIAEANRNDLDDSDDSSESY